MEVNAGIHSILTNSSRYTMIYILPDIADLSIFGLYCTVAVVDFGIVVTIIGYYVVGGGTIFVFGLLLSLFSLSYHPIY